ncbi:MAG: tetratricopeptide repeat protein, partial [Myxococcales bacterium]|nr:tetratricopeptide repeat protein [Myxococcales bacterium]
APEPAPLAAAPEASPIAAARAALLGEGWSERVALYQREITLEGEKVRRAVLEHEIGELLEFHGDDEGAAVASYGQAFASDPSLRPNLWAIRRVCQRRALWPNLLKLIEAEIRMAAEPALRGELWAEKGHLLEDRLEDPIGAREAFERALVEDPTSLPALMALEKIASHAGDVGALAQIYRGMATATGEPGRRVALLLDLARLQGSLPARDGVAPDDEALRLLHEAYKVGVERERVLDEIERIAEAAGRPEGVLAALEARVALIAERPDSAEAIVALRRRQALIARERSPERAQGYLEQALALLPDEPVLLADLADLAKGTGRYADHADLVARRAAGASAVARPGLLLEQAEALRRAGRDGDADGVEAELAAAPGGAALPLLLLQELRSLRSGDVVRLGTLHGAEAELARSGTTPTGAPDPKWAAGAFAAAGAACERADDPDGAVAAYRAALAVDEGYLPAADALDRLLDHGGRHAERDALLAGQLAAATPARAERLMEELIDLRLEKLGDSDGAIALADALCEQQSDMRNRVRLIDLLRGAGRWREAADQLGRLGDALAEQGALDRAAEARLERADLLARRLDRSDEAIQILDQVVRAVPSHPRAAAELTRLLRASGRHLHLAAALRREIDSTLQPDRIDRLLFEIGDLHQRALGKPDEAAEIYRSLLDRSPGHPAALRALAAIYRRAGDTAHLGEVLEATAEATPAEEAQAIQLLRLAEVHEEAGRAELADETFARVLQRGPAALGVHAAFGRFRALARRREHGLLDQVMGTLATHTDGATAAALAEERSWLAGTVGGEVDAGEERLSGTDRGAATASPQDNAGPPVDDDLAAMVARTRFAARRGDPGALGDGLAAIARRSSSVDVRAALLLRSGLLAAAAGGEAGPRIAEAFTGAPEDPLAVVAAADLTDDPEAIARRSELAGAGTAVEWSLELAEALAARGRLREAATEVLRGLAKSPRHLGLLDLARRIARSGGDRLGQALATSHLAEALADPARAAAHFAEAGRLFDLVGVRDEAIISWCAVLARQPLDGEAYDRAHALILESGDDGGLEDLLGGQLVEVADAPRRVALFLERGDLRVRTGRRHAARDDLRAVLDLDPQHPEALRRLGTLLAEDGDRPGAVAALDAFVDRCGDADELRPILLLLAELNEALDALPEATRNLQRLLDLTPDDLDATERLVALLLAQREYAAAVALLRARTHRTPEGPARAELELRIATLCEERMKDGDAAREALARALDQQPLLLEALGRIVPLCDAQGERQLRDALLSRAAGEARAAIERAPHDPARYRMLEQILAWSNDEDARVVVAQVAALTGGEATAARDGGSEPARDLSPAGWELAMPPSARGAALEIWRDVHEAAARIFGPELEQLGVEKAERQNAKGIPLAWIPVDKIARALGVKDYELYRSPLGREVARTSGLALVLGSVHCEKLTGVTRFRVARKVVLMRERLGPLETAEVADLDLFFAGCARIAGATLAGPPRAQARVEERAKAIGKIIDRKTKKALQSHAPRFAAVGDVGAWRSAVLHGATRLGLAVAGDLGAALSELKIALRSDEGQDLVRFIVSEEFATLRRDLGMRE